jgi:hypothetical protein
LWYNRCKEIIKGVLMVKVVNVNKYGMVKLTDTFMPAVLESNKDNTRTVNVHFGTNMDIAVVVAKGRQLSKDNQERIRILTNEK